MNFLQFRLGHLVLVLVSIACMSYPLSSWADSTEESVFRDVETLMKSNSESDLVVAAEKLTGLASSHTPYSTIKSLAFDKRSQVSREAIETVDTIVRIGVIGGSQAGELISYYEKDARELLTAASDGTPSLDSVSSVIQRLLAEGKLERHLAVLRVLNSLYYYGGSKSASDFMIWEYVEYKRVVRSLLFAPDIPDEIRAMTATLALRTKSPEVLAELIADCVTQFKSWPKELRIDFICLAAEHPRIGSGYVMMPCLVEWLRPIRKNIKELQAEVSKRSEKGKSLISALNLK